MPALLPGLARLRGPRRQKEGRGNQAGAAHCWAKPEGEKGREELGFRARKRGEKVLSFFVFSIFLSFISKVIFKSILKSL